MSSESTLEKDVIIDERTVCDILKKSIISDYYTANIKAEVIFDMLLTARIEIVMEKIFGKQFKLLAKEMPILKRNGNYTNGSDIKEYVNRRGTKVDYVLASENNIFLVELKTSKSSLEIDQANEYLNRLYLDNKWIDFSELLKQLEFILMYSFKKFNWNKNDTFENLFMECVKKYEGNNFVKNPEILYVDIARDILMKNNLEVSSKYLYTAGMILDSYSQEYGKKSVRMVYITPDVKISNKMMLIETSDIKNEDKKGIIHITFNEIVNKLKNDNDSYTNFLKDILSNCGITKEDTP